MCADQTPQIIELAAGGVPWKEHLYELEKQEGVEGAIKFCLYEVHTLLLVTHATPASPPFLSSLSSRTSAAHRRAAVQQAEADPAVSCTVLPCSALQVQLLMLCFRLSSQDTREKKWRVQAVSVQPGSFENRRSLPAAWRGLRDDELSNVSGISGDSLSYAKCGAGIPHSWGSSPYGQFA